MTKIIDVANRIVCQINPTHKGENTMTCPICSPTRKKKRDKCLRWNADKGVGQCHHCGASFVAYDPYRTKPKKEYTVPAWRNKTELTDKAVKWFEGRCISQKTLNAFKIFSDTEFMPQFGKQAEAMCFPYFRGGEQVNIKFRGPSKSFKLVSGAELIFYNLDSVVGKKEAVIVEGEIDALSYAESGIPHVLSVPNGAGSKDLSFLDNCIDLLDGIETFYIATDQDEPGVMLRTELVRRLGQHRCRIVSFGGYKDANELLCSSGITAVRDSLKQAVELPLTGIADPYLHYEEAYSIFENGLDQGMEIGLPEIDEVIKWKTGLLAVWTGIPSHGKSEMLNFFSVMWNRVFGWKTAFFSPENMPYHKYLLPKLMSVITGKTYRKGFISDTEYEEAFDYICDNFKFIDADDDYTVETILQTAENLVRRYGIKALVIDPYNCFEHRQERGESETQYIGRFLDRLVRFAKKFDVLVNLVAHPRKMERLGKSFAKPTLYDISGSANFYNKTDIGITVYRNFDEQNPGTELIVSKVRFKELGQTGKVDLQYNLVNGRYGKQVMDVRDQDYRNYLHVEAVPSDGFEFNDFNEAAPF